MIQQPKTFAEIPQFLLASDGLNFASKWDGFLAAPVDAGVFPPSTPPQITFTGADVSTDGGLVGPFDSYVRWVDKWSNVGNLSPVSNEITRHSGTIDTFANAGGVWRITTLTGHGMVAGEGVHITGTGDVELDGITHTIGSIVSASSFDLTTAFASGGGSGGTWQERAFGVVYTGIPVPTDPNYVGYQVLRPASGNQSVYYVDLDVTPAGLRSGVVAHWRFDETSGDAVDEVSGIVLTDNNTVGTAAGKVGTARDFEAGNSESFSLTEADYPGKFSFGDTSFGISCWINLESGGADRTIACKGGNGTTPLEWRLDFVSATNNVRFAVSDGVTTTTVTNGTTISTATWYFVDAYYDSFRGLIFIRVNDSSIALAAVSITPIASTGNLSIGATAAGAAFWDGLLDALTIYRRTTTDADSTVQYNSGNGLDWPWEFSTQPTSLSSFRSDDELTTQEAVAFFDSDGFNIVMRYGLPPNTKSVIVYHQARLWAAVDVDYTQGAVAVTNASTTVTGFNTAWTEEMGQLSAIPGSVGREFLVAEADDVYLIESVDVANQTLTLTEPYAGTTDNYTAYAIRPAVADRRNIAFSEPGLPEAFAAWNVLPLDEDGDELTGLMPLMSQLYVLEERHTYRLTAGPNPLVDAEATLAAERGCVNQRCWVRTDDRAFLLDRDGIWSFNGSGFESVSDNIQEVFDPESDSPYRVNWAARRYFSAALDPARSTVRFFVSLDSDVYGRHAICLDYRSGAIWIEEFPEPVSASCTARLAGTQTRLILLGSAGDQVFAYPMGQLDGIVAGACTLRGTVTDSGLMSITDSQAVFTSAVVGLPVTIVEGKGRGQTRLIEQLSGTTIIYINNVWTDQPDTTSKYQIGGISWNWKSGKYRYSETDDQTPRRVQIVYRPTQSEAAMAVQVFEDQDEDAVEWAETRSQEAGDGVSSTAGEPHLQIDTTKSLGVAQQRLDERRETQVDGPRHLQVEISGTANVDRQTVKQLVIDGVEE